MSDLIGKSLDRYHILEQIGRGGMALVYRALDTQTMSDVAVKVIRVDQEENIKFLERFDREAHTLEKLKHPHIVPVLNYGKSGKTPYLVMEYLPGGTLKQFIGKPMPWQKAFEILIPVAQALEYAHQQGILHRDVKPSNILITKNHQPMLTDFGVAKMFTAEETSDLTGTGVGVGTPEYMAPEQATSKSIDQRVDIYALGIILFELLAGVKPFHAETPMGVLLQHMQDPIPSLRSFSGEIPRKIERIVLKALQKNPDHRYHSMSAFSVAMQDALKNLHGQGEANQGNKKGQWLLVGALGAGFLGLIGLVAGILLFLNPSDEKPDSQEEAHPGSIPSQTPQAHAVWEPGPSATLISSFTPEITVTATGTSVLSGESETVKVSPVDGMSLVFVPAGEFRMGSNRHDADEMPEHNVFLDDYWMDQTEVTNAMYLNCVEAGVCSRPHDGSSYTRSIYFDSEEFAQYPVINVDWFQAQTYCEWAGRRLPTEAEWEKAARGTEGTIYPWGNNFVCSMGNFDDEKSYSKEMVTGGQNCDGFPDTSPVGTFPTGSSRYGVLDMAGNVREWVLDWYSEGIYQNQPVNNPGGPLSGIYRVIRSGSWAKADLVNRSSNRGYAEPDGYGMDTGFRCVASE